MPDHRPLPQEFPRNLALLSLADVAPDLGSGAREAFTAAFDHRQMDPLDPRGLLLVGPGGLRPLMAMMRLVVLRLRDLNFERFARGEGPYRNAYCRGETLQSPLPDRAVALFIERADRIDAQLAPAVANLTIPVFATWEGPPAGPVWDALAARCDVIHLG